MARTVSIVEAETVCAVKRPDEEISPVGEDVQVTAVFVDPVTVALNCCVCPDVSEAVVGETETDTGVTVPAATRRLVPEVFAADQPEGATS